ncbi:NAD(P)-dependent oxidoreductase [Nocardioides cynanchi]|uniref:NAD(P)-dependent oxidoreductase n=1 Tax=Nocardioides cynanchi TaxID=2558918 RepID=UPI001247DDB0|nr:NAD(P)-dependent oxidoreductase [Nocardioides cynanchi]
MRTAVLGTGIMGAAMARSLAREGHEVRVWNRTPERADAVAGSIDGGPITAHREISDALAGCDVAVTMLYDADSVLEIVDQVVAGLGPETVWLQCSTVGPAGMARIAEAATPVGARLVDAPVLGTRQPAETGNLVVLVSGAPTAVDHAQPVLDAVGARTLRVADTVGAASALKLASNSWVASINAAAAQALGLAEALGLEPGLFLEAIKGGASDSVFAQMKGSMMAERSWAEPAFALDSVRKDVGLMIDAAEDASFPVDLLSTLLALYDRASERGHGEADMAAVRTAFDR